MASPKPEDLALIEEARPAPLSVAEKRDWIRLIRTDNIGPITFHQLIAHFGSAAAAIEAVPELRRRGGLSRPGSVRSVREAERELRAAEKAGVRIAAFPEPDYPPLLRHIDAPPPLVFLKGDPAIAERPAVAIVGSRSASAAGRQFAHCLAGDLGACGVTVVSGLARGIDTAAHHGAVASGTVAVLAGGVDVVYPPENAELHGRIAAQGLLVSESPLGFTPRGQDFPRRNRLISGLSAGVVVVEAAERSGSLITARMALEQNREVFAVPGHPLDPRAAGTNELIKAGATLITCAGDIIEALSPAYFGAGGLCEGLRPASDFAQPAMQAAPEPVLDLGSADRALVQDALSHTPVGIDLLVRMTGLSPSLVALALLELDLAGRIERHGQHGVSLKAFAEQAL